MDLHIKLTTTPIVAIVNTVRLPYHIVKPPESKEFARNGRNSQREQISLNTMSQKEATAINCLTQKLIEQLIHFMVAVVHKATDGIEIAYL